MIQANELRVGNLLNYDTAEGDVVTLTTDFNAIQWATEDQKGFNLVHTPIPLTEEWLLKFGFEKNRVTKEDNNIWRKVWDEGHFELEEIISFFFGQPIHETQLQYVHQLQNLYFAITGEELTIKN